jgi:hypothetical protein
VFLSALRALVVKKSIATKQVQIFVHPRKTTVDTSLAFNQLPVINILTSD